MAEQSFGKIHLPATEHFQAARHPLPCVLRRRKTGHEQRCLLSSNCWEAGADQPFLVLESQGAMPHLIFLSESLQQEFETPQFSFRPPTHSPFGCRNALIRGARAVGCEPAPGWKAGSHVSDGTGLIKPCRDLAAKLLGPREPEDKEKGLSKRRVFQGRNLERTAEGEAKSEGRT